MPDVDKFEDFDGEIDAIERSLGGARDLASAFETELTGMRSSLAAADLELKGLRRGVTVSLKGAFDALVLDGERLSDVMQTLASSISRSVYNASVRPIFSQAGSALSQGIERFVGGLLPFANGAPFSQGRVIPFASGGIVNGPVRFPMRGGTGLMGEAGPEAILPLSRGADGRLGVRTEGGGRPTTVVFNISTPDVAGFERSQSQIAAQMSRALGRANRNR